MYIFYYESNVITLPKNIESKDEWKKKKDLS